FKDLIPNLVAGLLIYFKKKIRKNEYISFEQAEGKVTKINLLDTRLKMKDGDVVIVPNTLIQKSKIVKKKK
ncbi:mechanosensitive ion channel, partial [archaeon]|nr:mechanosensitive ion channel [archaeon]